MQQQSCSEQHAVRGFLSNFATRTGIPGVSVAMSLGGRKLAVTTGLRAASSAAALSSAARFEIACLSKLLLSIAMLRAAESNRVDLNARIGEHLPELAGSEKGQKILLWNLLSHTSGYQNGHLTNVSGPAQISWDQLMEFLRQTPQLFQPGTVLNYSDIDYVLVREILRRMTGQRPPGALRDLVLDPWALRRVARRRTGPDTK